MFFNIFALLGGFNDPRSVWLQYVSATVADPDFIANKLKEMGWIYRPSATLALQEDGYHKYLPEGIEKVLDISKLEKHEDLLPALVSVLHIQCHRHHSHLLGREVGTFPDQYDPYEDEILVYAIEHYKPIMTVENMETGSKMVMHRYDFEKTISGYIDSLTRRGISRENLEVVRDFTPQGQEDEHHENIFLIHHPNSDSERVIWRPSWQKPSFADSDESISDNKEIEADVPSVFENFFTENPLFNDDVDDE